MRAHHVLHRRLAPASPPPAHSSIDFPPATELMVVAATRGAADDFARDYRAPPFDLRCAPVQPGRARGPRRGARTPPPRAAIAGTQTNAEAMAARVAFDAVAAGDLAYFGPVAAMPGFPESARADDSRAAARGRERADAAARRRDAGARDICASACSASKRSSTPRPSNDRAALFSMAASAWRDGLRWFGYPVLLLDVPLNSVAERQLRPDAWSSTRAMRCVTCPAGDEATRDVRSTEHGADVEEIDDDAPATTDLGRLRRHIFTRDPPPESAARRRRPALFRAGRSARSARDRAPRARRDAQAASPFDEMAVCLRAPQQYLGLARARVRAGGSARVFRSRDSTARSDRARLCRAAVVRLRDACPPGGSTSICRSARCRGSVRQRGAGGGDCPRRRGVRAIRGAVAAPTSRRARMRRRALRLRRRRDRRRYAARAVEMGRADCRIGGDRRRAIARTAGAAGAGGSTASPPSYRLQRDELRRDDPESPRLGAHRARPAQPAAPARRSRCPVIDDTRRVARRGDVGRRGSIASRRSPRACSRARRACCASSRSSGRWRRSVPSRSKKRATCCRSGC